jgi:guanylate kinase
MPPSIEELENRLVKRNTDSPAIIRMRVEKAREEIKLANQFDTIINNNQLDKAKQEVQVIVKSFLENKSVNSDG